MFRKLMIACWTLFALFTALATICWHYWGEASQRGDAHAIQSFEQGLWFGVIGASLILVFNIIIHVGHSARVRQGVSE